MPAADRPCIVEEINEEILKVTRALCSMGVPFEPACDIAFDAVIAALAREAPCALAVYRAAIIADFPAIFVHLN